MKYFDQSKKILLTGYGGQLNSRVQAQSYGANIILT